MEQWMVWAGLGAVVLILIMIYNRMVSLRQRRGNAFSDIDVQLKLRYDLVPNLVETVKGYASHEKDIMLKVTEARASAMRGGPVDARIASENKLSGALMNLMAVAENYPQLKADANFQQLSAELSDIENKISAARRFFNNATAEYNTAIQQFPAVLFAGLFGFKSELFFELSPEDAKAVQTPPKVSF